MIDTQAAFLESEVQSLLNHTEGGQAPWWKRLDQEQWWLQKLIHTTHILKGCSVGLETEACLYVVGGMCALFIVHLFSFCLYFLLEGIFKVGSLRNLLRSKPFLVLPDYHNFTLVHVDFFLRGLLIRMIWIHVTLHCCLSVSITANQQMLIVIVILRSKPLAL